MAENQELVNIVDPQLTFRKNLMIYADRPVYQVEKEDVLYVLKPFSSTHGWQRSHIEKEKFVLQGAHDIEGITHLVHDYGKVDRYIAILKEFAEGDDLQQLGGHLDDIRLQSQVEETIRALHDRGYANIELRPRNVVVGPDKSYVKIVDLGTCISRTDFPSRGFEIMQKRDFRALEKLTQ